MDGYGETLVFNHRNVQTTDISEIEIGGYNLLPKAIAYIFQKFEETRDCQNDMDGLRCLGEDDDCCTSENPCKKDGGDCDDDNQCEGDLVCGEDNCKESWIGTMNFKATTDCCRDPCTYLFY